MENSNVSQERSVKYQYLVALVGNYTVHSMVKFTSNLKYVKFLILSANSELVNDWIWYGMWMG